MLELKEAVVEARPTNPLTRFSASREESARIFSPVSRRILIPFGDRGELPLSSGWIYRVSSVFQGRVRAPRLYFQLFGFDEAHRGNSESQVGGTWSSSDIRLPSDTILPSGKNLAQGRAVYRGGLELLPEDFVKDAIALLENRGGVDLEGLE